MTELKKRFCEEYIIDLNAKQAAIRAGYAPRSAAVRGCELLKQGEVRDTVGREMAKRSRRTGVSADRVVRELARIAFANAEDIIDFDTAGVIVGVSREDTAAVVSVRVRVTRTEDGETVEQEVKLADKNKALELLGRHMAIFVDKQEHSIDLKGDKLADILAQLKAPQPQG